MRHVRILAVLVALASAAVLGGAVAYSLPSTRPGVLAVYVEGTPTAFAHVFVTFRLLSIHEVTAPGAVAWLDVPPTTRTLDLAAPVDVSALLASARVPAADYTQVRIEVSTARGVMADGRTVTFTIPSAELKTEQPFTVTAGTTTVLILQIDLVRSIVLHGSAANFTPVLGAIEIT